MPDDTNPGQPTDTGSGSAAKAGRSDDAGTGSPLTTGRQIGVDADEAGDNNVVSTQPDQSGHGPTGGAEH